MAASDNGNPFTDETLTNHPSVEAQPANGNPFADESLTADPGASTGQVTNDVGNQIIVPKDGESFADTMKRAAAHGKTVTQDQINKELATAPGKVATVVGAAPAIGAGGAAALAAPGEIPAAAEKLLQISSNALEHLAENYPQLTKLAGKLGYGAGAIGAYKLLNKLGIH